MAETSTPSNPQLRTLIHLALRNLRPLQPSASVLDAIRAAAHTAPIS